MNILHSSNFSLLKENFCLFHYSKFLIQDVFFSFRCFWRQTQCVWILVTGDIPQSRASYSSCYTFSRRRSEDSDWQTAWSGGIKWSKIWSIFFLFNAYVFETLSRNLSSKIGDITKLTSIIVDTQGKKHSSTMFSVRTLEDPIWDAIVIKWQSLAHFKMPLFNKRKAF